MNRENGTMEKSIYPDRNGDSMSLKYRVVLEPGEDGWIVAHVPAVKGCWSQGKTREEALKNITEALQAIIEDMKEDGDPIPEETEVVINA
jgi:predicted RNase H-like HicB family nuclease